MTTVDPLTILLQATALGDQNAFAELYRQTGGRLYAIALRILRQPDQAGEVVQETFVRIWTKAEDFDPARGRPTHWMGGIARNIAIDLIRRGAPRREDSMDLDELEIPVAPHDTDRMDIERCMAELDRHQCKVIKLAVLHGLTHTELAQRLGMPIGTIKSTIRRGLAKLKTCLGPEHAYA